MNRDFDLDPFPGRPKILFIGWPGSPHTHGWIDLLKDADFNVRLFSLHLGATPTDWWVRSYLTAPETAPEDAATRRTVMPPAASPEAALAAVVREWRPDIIHTLGFDPASYLYLRARDEHGLSAIGRWIAQARGGPDIALQQFSPDFRPKIEDVLTKCDHFIADNQRNYEYARELGLAPDKIENPGMGIVSGAGGLDLKSLRTRWRMPPSKRERLIVWPKAYEVVSSKAMPVFEAILLAWDKIKPCRIEMLWMDQPEVRIWYERMFPPEIRENCPASGLLPHEQTLALIARARVMMAPSLSDGIPNSMMEAMALGAVPLVSPIETITPVVRAEENVVFARNLYPQEIADALVRLMSDDPLVDRLAARNTVRVYDLADRTRFRGRALEYYEQVAGGRGSSPNAPAEGLP